MSNKNPCFNCVTYAICRAELLEKLSEFSTIKVSDLLTENMYMSYCLTLKKKCSLIKDYILNQSNYHYDVDNIAEYNHDLTQTVYQTMSEAFNI